MRTLLMDSDNDLVFVNYGPRLTDGSQAILQAIKGRLELFRGEWFLDTSRGVPWFEEVLRKGASRATVDSILKREILAVRGVLALEAFSLSEGPGERTLNVDFTVRVDGGASLSDSVSIAG